MRQLAIYGKGGIGKSMVASHISYALADQGKTVLHVGCDPKHDSTRLLLDGRMPVTILDMLRAYDFKYDRLSIEQVVYESTFTEGCRGKVYCAESGGPEAGVGCGGKGVIEAIETLERLTVFKKLGIDVVIYDVLGDVVCGGFSMPIRQGYAREIYIVTSGEIEVLFAACNIFKAIARFSAKSGARLGGIIGNLREMKNEQEILSRFAAYAGTQVVGFIPYSETIKACSGRGATLFQHAPDSPECSAFKHLAQEINNNTRFDVPERIDFVQLHTWWAEQQAQA